MKLTTLVALSEATQIKSVTRLSLLILIHRNPGANLRALRTTLDLDNVLLNQILNQMRYQGYITRNSLPKREFAHYLTPTTAAAFNQILPPQPPCSTSSPSSCASASTPSAAQS